MADPKSKPDGEIEGRIWRAQVVRDRSSPGSPIHNRATRNMRRAQQDLADDVKPSGGGKGHGSL